MLLRPPGAGHRVHQPRLHPRHTRWHRQRKFAGNYAPAYPAQEQARQAGCHQVVWLDPVERRWVEELGGMNLFFVRGSGPTAELLTPPAVGTLLPGVTRDSLLRLAGRLGLTVREEPVSVEQWKALSVTVTEVCRRAREASTVVRELTTEAKDRVLAEMADAVDGAAERLKKANALDVEAAREAGTSATLTDRLTLTDKRIAGMTSAIRTIIDLQDPVGQVVKGWTRPNGIHIDQVREPLGVVAVIYEARPNVTAEVAALCLKSGNSAVLRGSSIAMHTNVAISEVLTDVLRRSGDVPDDAVQLIRDPSREAALELLHADEYVDLLVPRGGPGLIKTVRDNATVPTVIDGDGNCHVYVDATADLAMATDIVVNGKTSRPSVCNACAEGKHDKESDKNHATFVSYHGRGSRSRNNAGPVRGARLPGPPRPPSPHVSPAARSHRGAAARYRSVRAATARPEWSVTSRTSCPEPAGLGRRVLRGLVPRVGNGERPRRRFRTGHLPAHRGHGRDEGGVRLRVHSPGAGAECAPRSGRRVTNDRTLTNATPSAGPAAWRRPHAQRRRSTYVAFPTSASTTARSARSAVQQSGSSTVETK
nr:glutamate-5-semialdehyde dehydrogenase [Streptomyces chryseus]